MIWVFRGRGLHGNEVCWPIMILGSIWIVALLLWSGETCFCNIHGHLPHYFSDNFSVMINTARGDCGDQNPRRRSFRFDSALIFENSCENEVRRLWECSSSPIPNRLFQLGLGLTLWSFELKKSRKQ